MALPDFFIIGAPKCGTTTLYQWLEQHPQVYMPHKEPCFFSQDIEPTVHLPTHISTLADYEALFANDDPCIKVTGEASPKYLYSDNALDQIALLRPDAKIIICLRDPIELAISFHNQKVKEGVEMESDFARAWARSENSEKPGPFSMQPWLDGRINYIFWASYGRRIEQVFKRFQSQNIRIYTLRQLEKTPDAVLYDLCNFLGISEKYKAPLGAKNVGYKMRSARLHRVVIAIKRRMAPVLRLLGRIRGREGLGVLRLLQRLNSSDSHYADAVPASLKSHMNQLLMSDRTLAQRFMDGKPL